MIKSLCPSTFSLDQAYAHLNVLPIESLYKLEIAKFIYYIRLDKVPKMFENYVSPISHTYNTRSKMNGSYQLYKPRTELGKTLINFQGVKYWNSLPKTLVDKFDFGAPQQFKASMKKHLLQR